MNVFEYLPQLIVAYDSNDEFANLIHIKRAKQDEEYYCPCCGGIVKPRALDSTKEQSHYFMLQENVQKKVNYISSVKIGCLKREVNFI